MFNKQKGQHDGRRMVQWVYPPLEIEQVRIEMIKTTATVAIDYAAALLKRAAAILPRPMKVTPFSSSQPTHHSAV